MTEAILDRIEDIIGEDELLFFQLWPRDVNCKSCGKSCFKSHGSLAVSHNCSLILFTIDEVFEIKFGEPVLAIDITRPTVRWHEVRGKNIKKWDDKN